MQREMVDMDNHNSGSSKSAKHENSKLSLCRDGPPVSDLWNDGLICAFEYVRGNLKKPGAHKYPNRTSKPPNHSLSASPAANAPNPDDPAKSKHFFDSKWVPIGWSRISELVQQVQADSNWAEQQMEFSEEEDDYTVADVAAPYWERPAGPTWWCHVAASHPSVDSWLGNAQWLHPAIGTALRDESRLISDRMKHLLYEVPVRVAGGLLFELLGQSVGDPLHKEEDTPIVLRCWQAQNFLISAMHLKGTPSNLNVLGITEVLELLLAGGSQAPRSVHEVIAHLTCRLSRWDDRLFRKYVFGEADEIELKFVNRRNYEDLNLLSIILNQEIKRLATQVIRVKWSLHAREEIVFELIQHLRGNTTRSILEAIKKSTRVMLEEQEAVRGRLFTIQDVMQSTVRAWLQDRSLRVTHNLGIFGGCGLVLSIITGLFGINVDGIPGAENTPYAFGLFTGLLFMLGFILIGIGMLYLGLQNPVSEEKVKVRKLELQQLVNMFQYDAEHHTKVREGMTRHGSTPDSSDTKAKAHEKPTKFCYQNYNLYNIVHAKDELKENLI